MLILKNKELIIKYLKSIINTFQNNSTLMNTIELYVNKNSYAFRILNVLIANLPNLRNTFASTQTYNHV